MPISVSTVYTRERLLRFNNFVMASRKFTWILFGVCTLWVVACFVLLAAMGLADATVTFCMILLLAMDVVYVLCAFVLPRFTLKRARNLDLEIHYTFDTESLALSAANDLGSETSTIRYAALVGVSKRDTELYLLISRRQGFIVDLTSLPAEQLTLLHDTLAGAVTPKKFKWKD